MAISPPKRRLWWKEPIGKAEIIWIAVAFIWGLVMFGAMIYWHIGGKQNLSNETYRIEPEMFEKKVEAMVTAHTVGKDEESGQPIVQPPPGSDIYMLARLWEWYPILKLKKDQTYRLHLSSLDWQHGFSLQPVNINVQVHPKYDLVMTVTPDQAGTYTVICNEYCGVGHHTMTGRIIVDE